MNIKGLHGKYLHYKGKYYDVLGEARDVDTHKLYVIYRQDYGHKHWWIRPKDMFFEKIERNGEEIWRFCKINDETNIPDIKTRTFSVKHTETGETYLAKYKNFYGQYLLTLENQYGEQMRLEFFFSKDIEPEKD